jgi:hypothetical protein
MRNEVAARERDKLRGKVLLQKDVFCIVVKFMG